MASLAIDRSAEPSTLRAQVVSDLAGFRQLAGEWGALYAKAHNAAPVLHHDWLSIWLDINAKRYLASADGLRVLCCRRGPELVGALPMYLRKMQHLADGGRCLTFISSGEVASHEICPDYMDALCLAEVKDDCADLFWRLICNGMGRSYDRVELSDIADCSALVNWARVNGPSFDVEVVPRGVCPIADLTGGFESYLSRLSANGRQQARRLLKGARQAGVVFEVADTPEQAQQFFDDMVTLHQARWTAAGQPGCFASDTFTRFHRCLVERWLASGRAILSRLRLADQTLAVKYGFRQGTKLDFYQSGVLMSDAQGIKSPGIVSFLMLMQYLAEHGITAFDFLRGSSHYKQRLATTAQPLAQVRRVQWTWPTAVGFAVDVGQRGFSRIGRFALRRNAKAENASAGERE